MPCKVAWNEGAARHMDAKGASEAVTHAGGDDEQFEAWFNETASILGPDDHPGQTGTGSSSNYSAGGDGPDDHPGQTGTGSSSNLKDRVGALEAKLLALEHSAGGGKAGGSPLNPSRCVTSCLTAATQDTCQASAYCKSKGAGKSETLMWSGTECTDVCGSCTDGSP